MEPTIEEIVKLEINYERGFYCDIRDGKLYAGRDKELGFCCSCQGYQSKLKAYRLDPTLPAHSCSHVGALKVWFVERNRAHGWGSFKGLTAQTREEDAEAFL
jgi:hypothetical protein